jgi:malate/lactate dehydrogenase
MLRAILARRPGRAADLGPAVWPFGIGGVYVGVPARLGRRGVSEIVTASIDEAEVAALRAAVEEVRTHRSGCEASALAE